MNFDSLPKGWAIAKTSEAIEANGIIGDGDWIESKDQDPNGDVRLIQLADIGDGNFRNKSERFMTSENAVRMNCTFIESGDVLIARMPDPLGRACIFPGVGQKAVTVVDICLIRPNTSSALQNKLLMYWINTPQVRNFIAMQVTGTTRKRITRKKLEELELPIPPLAEQQQIAAKLDELLAQVDIIKTRLDTIPKILKRFRQSVLAAAVSGKLTEDWRKEQGIDNWNYGKWEEILRPGKNSFKRGPFGSALKKNMFIDKGYKVYEQYCPINDDCSYARYYITQEKFNEMQTFEVMDCDFLISCSGVSLGRITQVPRGSERGIINQALLRVRLDSLKYDDDFFILLFRSPTFQKSLVDNSTGSAIPNLKGVKELKSMAVPLPHIEEQTEIVRRAGQLFTYADQVEQRVKDAQARVNQLTQAILAKAFRGDLTADWREQNPELISGENSAAALLERIKLERSMTAAANKAKTTKVKKPSDVRKSKQG